MNIPYWKATTATAQVKRKPVTQEQLEALRHYADPLDATPNTPVVLLGKSETISLIETFDGDLAHLVRTANKLGWNHVNAAGLTLYFSATIDLVRS